MRIAFIIVHYHTAILLRQAVTAIITDLAFSGLDADLIVVDNGSNESERKVMETLPGLRVDAGKNRGYAGGINLGAAQTQADLLFLMNADVLVQPGCTRALMRALESGASAAGPRFYLDQDKQFLLPPTEERTRRNEVLRRLAPRGDRWARVARGRWRRHAHHHWQARGVIESHHLSGALLAVKRRALDKVGPFDEVYRLYFEESDWLMRLKRAGLTSCYVPTAEAVHFYNQSAAREPQAKNWAADSAAIFARRHYGKTFCAVARHLSRIGQMQFNSASNRSGESFERTINGFLHSSATPLWLELSPSPLGFPAAAALIDARRISEWYWPPGMWAYMQSGKYFLRVVAGDGQELAQYSYEWDKRQERATAASRSYQDLSATAGVG